MLEINYPETICSYCGQTHSSLVNLNLPVPSTITHISATCDNLDCNQYAYVLNIELESGKIFSKCKNIFREMQRNKH